MKILNLILLLLLLTCSVSAQSKDDPPAQRAFNWENSTLKFGLEVDPLPFFNKGYDFSFWTSYYLFRARLDWAYKFPAAFVTTTGFKDLRYKSFTFDIQYFPTALKPDLTGLWFGIGYDYWNSIIKNAANGNESSFANGLLNFSVGYPINIYDKFYLNPYFAGHLRLFGKKSLIVGGKNYNTQSFTPEISVRLGYHL